MLDWILYIVLRTTTVLLRLAPLRLWLALARFFAGFYYLVAARQNRKAFAHLKLAFPQKDHKELKKILRTMYGRFAQNFVEALFMPHMDEDYVRTHVKIKGGEYVSQALENKQGVIFVACHAGSWELSNITCAMLYPQARYAVLARPQKGYRRLDAFLNRVRESKGCHVIRVNELKKMVEHLGAGHMLGTVADHGGRDGLAIPFFGKLAMTPTSSIKMAKKLNARIILAYMHRLDGLDHEMIFKPLEVVRTADASEDLYVNLTAMSKVLENWVAQYPEEYLWFYRRWKHSPQKNILILSDGKPGHVKQSLACAELVSALGFTVHQETVEVIFKNKRQEALLAVAGTLFGAQAAQALLRFCLGPQTYCKLTAGAYDLVISAGSSLASVNLAMATQNNAQSVVLMRPGIVPLARFDLVVMPLHDRPPQRKNICAIPGSLTGMSADSLSKDFQQLVLARPGLRDLQDLRQPKIGVLLGGISKNYGWTIELASLVSEQLKKISSDAGAVLLLTTSRRTPPAVTYILRTQLAGNPQCRLFVDVLEDNPAGTVGGICYASDIVVVSGESISMVSEAMSSGKRVVVFEPVILRNNNKVRRFLRGLAEEKLIVKVVAEELCESVCSLLGKAPGQTAFDAAAPLRERLKRML
ncbi:MAG: ELM1/GtrOC1 family putative glycosyltransferase [Candidatus Omnitrophota bacterium]